MFDPASTDLTGKTALATGASGGIMAVAITHISAIWATVSATSFFFSFDGDATYQSACMMEQTIDVDGGNVLR
jgi:hypothetical protein